MGLLRAGAGAFSGTMGDQWREFFYCDSMSADVLAVKGQKRVGKHGSNKKGEDNIISNGSVIAVNDGQCMIIVDQGKVAELCAEPGEFIYDSSTEPSIFYGGLGKNIPEVFATMGYRVGMGGGPGKDQRVYFINTKEIIGNKYGTPNPVPFRVVDEKIGLDVDIAIRCHGEYSYHIVNPILFYTNVTGNVADTYTRDQLDSQLKSEMMTALQPAFAQISAMGIRYSALPGHTTELTDAMNSELSEKWGQLRGIEIVSMGMSSVTASEEDEKMIKELQRNAVFQNPNMAAAQLVGAQSQAMQDAAKNPNAGPVMGFAGMNMAQNAGGANAATLFAMGQQGQPQGQPAPAAAPQAAEGWTCEKCAHGGNTGKFCQECGAPRPAGAPLYKCDKCGYEPPNPQNPPKFCPECGDVFDENDVQK